MFVLVTIVVNNNKGVPLGGRFENRFQFISGEFCLVAMVMNLYDFLSEIRIFQRSEGIDDDELMASVVHLLSGRARLWYRAWFDTFNV